MQRFATVFAVLGTALAAAVVQAAAPAVLPTAGTHIHAHDTHGLPAALSPSRVVFPNQIAGQVVGPPTPLPVSGFICPMHPDVIEAGPGKCPRCGMELVPGNPLGTADYRLSVETTPRVIKVGEKVHYRLVVKDPVTAERVTNFAVVHDMPYHLFVLSRDMTTFMHIHPAPDPDGVFAIDITLPKEGHYVLISDFFPIGGSNQALLVPIVTAGFDGDVMSALPTLVPDTSWSRTEGGVTVDLKVAQSSLVASEDLDLNFTFTDVATGEPVKDLERYLGAFAHALIVNEDLTEYIHAHPAEMLEGTDIKSGGGPDVVFHSLFPKAGRYRAYIQYQRQGVLSTVFFTFRVLNLGETAP